VTDCVRTDLATPPYRITSTDFTYTGQRDLPGTGLMDYNARFYSPYLNQFTQPDTIVPNLYNPQSLNRYAYALNNPIRYNDPSGHRECESDSKGHCMSVKKLKLWNFAFDTVKEFGEKSKGKDKKKDKNSLEAMARIVDKAAQLYGTYDNMIPELSEIFLGVHESNPLTLLNAADADPCAAVGREDCGTNTATGSFGDAGFHQDFQDGFSQPFHFWAYVATTANTEGAAGPASYVPGRVVATWGNIYHEIVRPDGAGATWQDYALARAGMNIGTLVNMGMVPPDELGNTIRDYVGDVGGNGPGAFYVDPLSSILPLQGNRR